jgi:hypothetical protein
LARSLEEVSTHSELELEKTLRHSNSIETLTMDRRRYLCGLGGCFVAASLSGCTGIAGEDSGPTYQGGTIVLENTGNDPVPVSVATKSDQYTASLDTSVAGGETVVCREFVAAEPEEIVTLIAQLGQTGDEIRFQFLPAGGGDDAPPEVARLTFENAVEAGATWTATSGRDPD